MKSKGLSQQQYQKVPERISSPSKKDSPDRSGFTSAHVGKLAELIFETEMVKLGYSISRPTLDSTSRYDFIVDDGNRLHRVQVKTLRRRKNGNYELKLRATHRSSPDYVYTPNDCDWVVGVDWTNSYITWVNSNDIKGNTSMSVGRWVEE